MKKEVKQIIELVDRCRQEVMPSQENIRKIKYQEEIAVLSNVHEILHEEDNISTTTLIHLVNTIRYFMRLYNREGNQDGEIDDMCSELQEELEAILKKEIRQEWANLIGLDKVKAIEKENWIGFDKKTKSIYKRNEIEIKFLQKDRVGDTVCFFSICYDFDNKKFSPSNCIHNGDGGFDNYDQLKEHNLSLKDRIIKNCFPFVYLP